MPKTFEFGISDAQAIAIHPEPVPISSIYGFSIKLLFSIAKSMTLSVSCLGMRTLELTIYLFP